MANNPMLAARRKAEAQSADAQERNRTWWQSLPMTYQGWAEETRTLDAADAFRKLEEDFLFHNPWLVENVDFGAFKGQSVLEIGCGAGAASCLFAKGGARVTAIDLTSAAAEMTTRNAASQGLDIEVQQMDAESMSFPAEQFDYVFSWGVLHHSQNTETAFAEVERVLRPHGSGLIMVYNKASLRYWLKGIMWLILKGKLFRGDGLESVQRYYTDGYYHRHFSPRELRAVLSEAGLYTHRIATTHMAKQMIPGLPKKLDEALKRRWGWLLVAEFQKPV